MMNTSSSIETLRLGSKSPKDRVVKSKGRLPDLVWLPEDRKPENFTFPQISPSLLLEETPFSLDSKVPLIPALDDVMMLCTTKLGTERFKSPQDAEFDPRTPNSPSLHYNFLHDPHLKKYLGRPSVRRSLVKQGLITEDGLVKCSPKEFNEFRQWIRRLKLNSMEASAREIAEREKEESSNSQNKLTEHSIKVLEEMKQKQYLAQKRYKKKRAKDDEDRRRLMKHLEEEFENIEMKKKEQQQTKKMVNKQREKELEQRKAVYSSREKTVKSIRMQQLSEKDEQYLSRKQELSEIRRAERKEKEKQAIEKWKRRQSYCLKMMEEKKLLLEKEMHERKNRMEERNEIFGKQRRRREKALAKSAEHCRELAMKNMQLANSFLKKAEAKKEAEIMRWREKFASTTKKQSDLSSSVDKQPDCEPADVKEPQKLRNVRGVDAAARNEDLDQRLAYLDDTLDEEEVVASSSARRDTMGDPIPEIEVTEFMDSHDYDSSFYSDPDETPHIRDHAEMTSPQKKTSSHEVEPKGSSNKIKPNESSHKIKPKDSSHKVKPSLSSGKSSHDVLRNLSKSHTDASVQNIARQVAKIALMKAAGQVDFDLNISISKPSIYHIDKKKSKTDASRSHSAMKVAGGASRVKLNKSASSHQNIKTPNPSRVIGSADDLISSEASRLAESALENVMLTLGCEQVDFETGVVNSEAVVESGDESRAAEIVMQNEHQAVEGCGSNQSGESTRRTLNRGKRHSILVNAEDSLNVQAKDVTKKAIVGAAQQIGIDPEAVNEVSEYVGSLLAMKAATSAEKGRDNAVHFDEDSIGSTPRNRSNSISERIPTPHVSLTKLENVSSIDDGVKAACKVLPEPHSSEESFKSTGSAERRMQASEQGRRPTPFFSPSVNKDILAKIRNREEKNKVMEAFGEEDEEELSNCRSNVHSSATVGTHQDSLRSLLEDGSKQGSVRQVSEVDSAGLNGEKRKKSMPSLTSKFSEYADPRQVASEMISKTRGDEPIDEATGKPTDEPTIEPTQLIPTSNEGLTTQHEELVHASRTQDVSQEQEASQSGDNQISTSTNAGQTEREANAKEKTRRSKSLEHSRDVPKADYVTYASMYDINPATLRRHSSSSRSRFPLIPRGSSQVRPCESVPEASENQESPGSVQSVRDQSAIAQQGEPTNVMISDAANTDSVRSLAKRNVPSERGTPSKVLPGSSASNKSIESSSSHCMPRVRQSKSRTVCNIDPSVYSCSDDEVSHNVSLNSTEVLANAEETETVVSIVRPSDDELTDTELNGDTEKGFNQEGCAQQDIAPARQDITSISSKTAIPVTEAVDTSVVQQETINDNDNQIVDAENNAGSVDKEPAIEVETVISTTEGSEDVKKEVDEAGTGLTSKQSLRRKLEYDNQLQGEASRSFDAKPVLATSSPGLDTKVSSVRELSSNQEMSSSSRMKPAMSNRSVDDASGTPAKNSGAESNNSFEKSSTKLPSVASFEKNKADNDSELTASTSSRLQPASSSGDKLISGSKIETEIKYSSHVSSKENIGTSRDVSQPADSKSSKSEKAPSIDNNAPFGKEAGSSSRIGETETVIKSGAASSEKIKEGPGVTENVSASVSSNLKGLHSGASTISNKSKIRNRSESRSRKSIGESKESRISRKSVKRLENDNVSAKDTSSSKIKDLHSKTSTNSNKEISDGIDEGGTNQSNIESKEVEIDQNNANKVVAGVTASTRLEPAKSNIASSKEVVNVESNKRMRESRSKSSRSKESVKNGSKNKVVSASSKLEVTPSKYSVDGKKVDTENAGGKESRESAKVIENQADSTDSVHSVNSGSETVVAVVSGNVECSGSGTSEVINQDVSGYEAKSESNRSIKDSKTSSSKSVERRDSGRRGSVIAASSRLENSESSFKGRKSSAEGKERIRSSKTQRASNEASPSRESIGKREGKSRKVTPVSSRVKPSVSKSNDVRVSRSTRSTVDSKDISKSRESVRMKDGESRKVSSRLSISASKASISNNKDGTSNVAEVRSRKSIEEFENKAQFSENAGNPEESRKVAGSVTSLIGSSGSKVSVTSNREISSTLRKTSSHKGESKTLTPSSRGVSRRSEGETKNMAASGEASQSGSKSQTPSNESMKSNKVVASVSSRFKPGGSNTSFTASKIYVAPVNPSLDFTASVRSGVQNGANKHPGPTGT